MFRVADGKINVFGRWVAAVPGSHEIRINKDTGTITTDGDGDAVCEYTLEDNGAIKINSLLPKTGAEGSRPVNALSWKFESIVARCKLYEDPLGVGDTVTTYVEGFVFSFNYYAVVNFAMAIKPYTWTGGRVCFDSMYTPSLETETYTAIPASGSCGTAGWDYYSTTSSVTPPSMGNYSFLNSASMDALEFYGNSTSISFSYRSYRKYMFFASNVYGMFESTIGPIGGSAPGFPPDGGGVPDPGDASFSFSMHSLRQ